MISKKNQKNIELKHAELNWEYGIIYNKTKTDKYLINPISAFKTKNNKFIVTDIELDSVLLIEQNAELKKEIFISEKNIKWAEEIRNGIFAIVRNNSIEIYNENKILLNQIKNPLIPNPSFVTSARNGRLFVVDDKNQFVGEFDKNGELTWSVPLEFGLKLPKSVTLSKNKDHCLIVDDLSNWVIEVDMRINKIVWSFGIKGKGGRTLDKLFSPKYSIEIDEGIIIVDSYTNRIICVSRKNKILWQYGNEFSGAEYNQLWRPTCCQYTENKTFIITDSKNDRIIEINKNKKILKTIGNSQIKTCSLRLPRSIVQDNNNNYIIADTHANRIAFLDSDLKDVVYKPSNKIELYWPRCVIIVDNNYWVADGLHNRLIIFDNTFKIIKEIYSIYINDKEYKFEDPHQICKSQYDDSYIVTSTSNNYIFRIDNSGNGLEVIATENEIYDPHSAIETKKRIILICDTGNSRIFIKYPDGNTKKLSHFIDSKNNLIKLNHPRFCCCYKDYYLLLDTGSRSIVAFDLDGNLLWQLIGSDAVNLQSSQYFYLDLPSFLYDPRWIFVTKNEDLLIADTGNNRVFSIKLVFKKNSLKISYNQDNLNYLKKIAIQIRKDIIKMVSEISSGHIGSSFSLVEIVVVLYYKVMNIDPKNPRWKLRDRFCLSKGHASPLLYAILANKKYFNKNLLNYYRSIEKNLEGHPAYHLTPGVDMTSGSLGQGLSQAVGIALAGKKDNLDYKVYCILGDGELQEGQVWEAAMFAANYSLNNLIAIIDNNKFQNDGLTAEINNCEPIEDKFKSFNWNVKIINGHNIEEIINCFISIQQSRETKPYVIIANTYKGYGLKTIENKKESHSWIPNKNNIESIYKEIEMEEDL